MKASILASAIVVVTVGCGRNPADREQQAAGARAVSSRVELPDLSRLEESVQEQLRERHTALVAKQKDPATSTADLGAAYGEIGTLLMAAGFSGPAEAALLNAQMLVPGERRWPYYLGDLYRTTGDVPKAAAAFERALQLGPTDVPTMVELAETALDRGRPDDAEPLFTKALTIDPRSASARYGLGRTALAKKEYARAVQNLEDALALDGKASVIHYPLAMAYRGLGDLRKAEWHLQQRGTLPLRPSPLRRALDDLLHSALTYEKNADAAGNRGEWAAAAAYLRNAVALAPTRASPRHKLGTALFYLGDRRGAADEFQEAVRLSPGFAAAHYALGVLHEETGEHQAAIESFSAAIKSEPVNIDARLGLADASRRSGRFDASLAEYERIMKIDPGAVKARFGYAAALIRLNRYREAGDRLTQAMTLYPNELSFARAAARLFAAAPDNRVRSGRRAQEIVKALVSHHPRTVDVVETMAMAAAEMGQYGDAVRWQREAVEVATRMGRREVVERLNENLKLYEAGRPCRRPWRADEPIEFAATENAR